MLVRNRGRCTGGPGTTALYAICCPLGEIAGNPRLAPGSPSILASAPFSRFLTWSRLPVMSTPKCASVRPSRDRVRWLTMPAPRVRRRSGPWAVPAGGVDGDRPEVDVGVRADETQMPSRHRRKERVIAARCHGLPVRRSPRMSAVRPAAAKSAHPAGLPPCRKPSRRSTLATALMTRRPCCRPVS